MGGLTFDQGGKVGAIVMLDGIIVVRKEPDFTSNDVVAKMRGICRQKKIGHTGTLDPAATGVLPLCLGRGTKLCDMLTDKDKEYVAEFLLGKVTDTQDLTGTILQEREVTVTEQEVRDAILSFLGEYDQIPPMYSALKVNGKKLYELAREGREVERKARRVRIMELEILEMQLPVVKVRVVCSKGTYIRTLGADIGEKLGCGATMQALVRTRVGRFDLREAHTLSELEQIRDSVGLESVLIPVESVFEDSERLLLLPEFDRMLDNGNAILPQWIAGSADGGELPKNRMMRRESVVKKDGTVRMCTSDGVFKGLYEYQAEEKKYRPVKMFL